MAKPLTCFLVTIQTGTEVARKVVDSNPFTIGRSLEAAISIVDTNVSRNHIMVKNKGGKVWLEDQGSINGTFINGVKLEPRRITPLEVDDEVRLGKTNVSFKITTIERVFAPGFINDSPDLQPNQKDSLHNLIQGAHAEAQRLVKLGKEIHDAVIAQAEGKAGNIENQMANQRTQILAQAQEKGNQLVAQAEEKAKKEVLSIHLRATEVRQKADEYRREMIDKAQDDVEKIYDQQREKCQEMLNDAQDRIAKLQEDAEAEAANIKRRAHAEAEVILREAQVQAEQDAKDFFESVRDETVRRMEDFEKAERERISGETKKLIMESEDAIGKLRIERKKAETEMNSEIRRLQAEVDSCNLELKELKGIIHKERKVAADEIAYERELFDKELKAEREAARKDLDAQAEQKRQEIEKLRALREEETRIMLKEKTLAFEKVKRQSEAEVESLTDEIKRLTPLAKSLAGEVTDLKDEEARLTANLAQLKEQTRKISETLTSETNAKQVLTASLKQLETDVGRLALDKQDLEKKLEGLQVDMHQRVAQHKSILDEEFSRLRKVQQEELDNLRLSEMERLKKDRQAAVEDFAREKESIAGDILTAVFEELTKPTSLGPQEAISDSLKEKINLKLEERSLSLLTSYHGEQVTSDKIKGQKKRERRIAVGQGLVAGMALLFIFQNLQEQFLADQNPMKTSAERRAQEREDDLARRKFDPAKDDELRDSYKDAVIYTKDFVEIYTSTDFQNKWTKAATVYMLKQWRIQEEKTVEALSAVTTLVKTLEEKKQSIHPDFVPDGLKKMADLEAETVAAVKETLGTEVRYEAFKKFEKKFYLNFRQERLPAQDSPSE